jgi:phytoene/squalene synthetase
MTSGKSTQLDFSPDVDFEDISTNPILDIAARFWDRDRYEAFRVCYRSMRLIDDLVDHRKSSPLATTVEERSKLKKTLGDWIRGIRSGDTNEGFSRELMEVLKRYKIPFWPWERFCKSMVYDLENKGYSSIISFLRYSEGAAIAPASIFMHLCGIHKTNGVCYEPPFDIRIAARPLALFCYFVHIIRDFQKDHKKDLNYFADYQLERYGLTLRDLKAMAEGAPITGSFRGLMSRYKRIAGYYRARSLEALSLFLPMLKPRYQLSIEMIHSLYLQIFERIDVEHGAFTGNELNPSPEEVKVRIIRTINDFSPVVQVAPFRV